MNPTRVLDLANAFWGSATLFAAADCGVFAALGRGPATREELAVGIGLPPRSLGMLLDALVGLELLTKAEGRYANTPEADAFLVPGKPGSLAQALGYNAGLFPAWGRLSEAIRSDRPVVESPTYLGKDPVKTRAFVMGMHGRALGLGAAIVRAIDLEGRRHLVDVGGGPGTLAVLLCRKSPRLRATVIEVPAVAEVGRELVAEAGLSDRIQFLPGDAFTGELGRGYDAALVSGLLHREPAEACALLCRRLFAALESGAGIFVVDVMRDSTRVAPAFATLFGLNMLLTSERGGCHADVDHVDWLTAAGFANVGIERLPAPMLHAVVRATKPPSA